MNNGVQTGNRSPESVRAIATSTLWQLLSQGAMAALSIVTTKFVAIGLAQNLAGTYNTAYGYLQLFGILADFGLYAVAVREVARSANREKTLGALIVLRCIILMISMGTALGFAWLHAAWSGTVLPKAILIASLVPSFTLLAGILRTVFQVEYRMHYVFIVEVVQRIITVSLIGLFIVMGVRNTENVSVLYAFLGIGGIGAAVLFGLSVILSGRLLRIRPCFEWPVIRNLLVQASPYGVAFLCTALYRQFDVTLIALLRSDYEIQNAYYGFVQRMLDMGYLLPTFLLNSTLPQLTERHEHKEDIRAFLGKIFLATLLLGTTTFLFAFFWARPLTHLLTTEQYLATATVPGSDTALTILSVSMFCNGFVVFAFYVLLTRHAWRPLVASLLYGAILSLLLNAWLIPHFGFVGAALTSAMTHIILAALLLPQSFRSLRFTITAKEWAQWASYTLLLALPLILLQPLLSSSVVTAVALVAMGVWMLAIAKLTGLEKVFL